MRTHFSTKEHLVTIVIFVLLNALFLATLNLPGSLKSRQVVAKSLLCILGVNFSVPILVHNFKMLPSLLYT